MEPEKQRIKSYRDLIIWSKGIELAKEVYLVTSKYPNNEIYGITNQMRRAGVSIPSNIAEGHARQSPAEFIHFLRITLGSLAELDTQLVLSKELGYVSVDTLNELDCLISELRRMIYTLLNKLPNPKR